MERKVKIKAGAAELQASLNDSRTAELLWNVLPLRASANIWGEEIYFSIPVEAELESPREVVEAGDIGYWPTGKAMCLFFGPTPVSSGDEIRPASAVDVLGRIEGDLEPLREVVAQDKIVVERA